MTESKEGKLSDHNPQDRTEAGEPVGEGKHHAPYAQMDDKAQKRKAPDASDHSAAGQGLSG